MFDVRLDGEDDLRRAWSLALGQVSDGIRTGVQKGVDEGAAEARTRHRYTDRTGNLTSKTSGRIITSTRGGAEGEIVADAPYASFVEEGTRAHVIVPRRGQWLAWERPQGNWHFARQVNHPGSKPYPFMGIAYLKCEAVIVREIEVGVARAERVLDE